MVLIIDDEGPAEEVAGTIAQATKVGEPIVIMRDGQIVAAMNPPDYTVYRLPPHEGRPAQKGGPRETPSDNA